MVGYALGLKRSTIKKIKKENNDDIDGCKEEMIGAWIDQVDNVRTQGKPSWKVLVLALRNPPVNQHQIAAAIAKKHQRNQDPN